MNKNFGYKLKKTFLTVLLIIGATALLSARVSFLNAGAETTVESERDSFTLLEKSYEKDDAFVFTSTAKFISGQATGLVFGGKDGESYYVFNIDRFENKVKLIYFSIDGGVLSAKELLTEDFIGNDKMTASERDFVLPRVSSVEKVQLKVVVTPEEDKVYAEFYADNIRRFGVDNVIELNALTADDEIVYDGGNIGYNTFNSKVSYDDEYYGDSDYSYYTELYRQQYHFSQYAHWNNDPNGLVYYNGWYHLYYQTNPFSNYWDAMFWGHARSRDLVHWEHLPICLFPDSDWGEGIGYMWSGSAIVYRKGMSAEIDNENWFEHGQGDGLLAFFTRDGARQDQVIMTSDDEGMTWVKRRVVPQSIATEPCGITGKADCRDPKIFTVLSEGGKTTLWGMALSGKIPNKIWFLKSRDLLNWEYAGEYSVTLPECPDVAFLKADDETTHAVMTLTGRHYIVGSINYEGGHIIFKDLAGGTVNDEDRILMDRGPDSYATQTYYIDDPASEYFGKTVSVSWFAGVPDETDSGIYANARKVWNGGGMTIPVVWGLKKTGGAYALTQTPITAVSDAFIKTKIIDVTGKINGNALSAIKSHTYEIIAEFDNPDRQDIRFLLNTDGEEYTEIGWTAEKGYYVSRLHTSSAGLVIKDYPFEYTTGETEGTKQTFYILSDNGGVEVFCENNTLCFYALTLSSPYAIYSSLSAGSSVTATKLTVNEIATVWREGETTEAVLYVGDTSVRLDTNFAKEKAVVAYSSSGADLEWAIETGEDVVELHKTETGAIIRAKSGGTAAVTVSCGNAVKKIDVSVYAGVMASDLTFDASDILSGNWYFDVNGLTGEMAAGDGYVLSDEDLDNMTLSATFSLDATAAALILRASPDMSEYIIANFDRNEGIVKVWSNKREIARAGATVEDLSGVTLKAKIKDRKLEIYLNGIKKISAELTSAEPLSGRAGLNVFSGKAVFSAITLMKENYVYESGDLAVRGEATAKITRLINRTLRNTEVSHEYFYSEGQTLFVKKEYFEKLSVGTYSFKAISKNSSFEFNVSVTATPSTEIEGATVEEGQDAVIYVGNNEIIKVAVNDVLIGREHYSFENGVLKIKSSVLNAGDNTVLINGEKAVTVSVGKTVVPENKRDLAPILIIAGSAAVLAAAGIAVFFIIKNKKKREKENDTDD